MATAPTLYWYQLDTGTLAPVYYGQLNATVVELCAENSVTSPTSPWWNAIQCSLVSEWLEQIDTAVRALCVVLDVTPMAVVLPNLNAGQYMATYWAQLDFTVRALTEVPSYEGPLDLVPGAVVAYSSARALSSAFLGSDAYTVKRDTDDTTIAAECDAVTGEISSSALQAFIGSPFTQAAALEMGNTEATLAAPNANIKEDQIVSGQGIVAGTFVQAVAGTVLILSEAPTETVPAAELTFERMGYVVEWSDQCAGGITLTQGAVAPYWIADALNGKPGMERVDFSFTQEGVERTDWASGTFSFIGVAKKHFELDFAGDSGGFLTFAVLNGESYIDTTDDTNQASATWVDVEVDDYVVFDGAIQFGQRSFKINGSEQDIDFIGDVGGPVGSIPDSLLSIITSPDAAGWTEFAIYPTYLSDANRLILRQNMATYYGITLA